MTEILLLKFICLLESRQDAYSLVVDWINGTSAQVLGLLLLLVGAGCTVFG
jgi:hypothetical protein